MVQLPAGTDELAVQAAARARGVVVYPLRFFAQQPALHPPAIVLGYTSATERQLRDAVDVLAEALVGTTDQARPRDEAQRMPGCVGRQSAGWG